MTNYNQEGDALFQAEKLLANDVYQQKLRDAREAIESFADCLVKVSGIDRNDAKTVAYNIASGYREDRRVLPSVDFLGETGTGKSECLKIVQKYANKPSEIINAKDQTFPVVRDKIIDALEINETNKARTIIIEEVDRCIHSRKLEEFIGSSYDKVTSKGAVKRAQPDGTFPSIPYCSSALFVGHRRHSHFDSANARRAIVVPTHQIKDKDFPLADEFVCPYTEKMELFTSIQLPPVTRTGGLEGGIWSNWEMPLQLAMAVGDTDWMNFAIDKMKSEGELLRSDRSYEPKLAIFNSLEIHLKLQDNYYHKPVLISNIKDTAKKEYDLNYSNRAVARSLRELKIKVEVSHGYTTVFPNIDSVEKARQKLGLGSDEGD